jgi:microcystin-dependent protein
VNLPTHSHSLQALAADGSSTATAGASLANPVASYRGMDLTSSAYATSGTPVTLAPASIGTTGSGQPVTNLPPQLGMRYCIALQGLFPYQN